MPYQAILFDLDGTLVDTISLYERAVLASLQEIGIEASAKQFYEWYVTPLHLKGILALYGKTEDQVPGVRARRDELYEELLSTDSTWLPGAEECLQLITSQNIPTAIVTGSWMSYVDQIDAHLDIRQYIQEFITVDDMGHLMKPHPHGLLLACDLLHVDPKDCIYIGDQQFDVDAANAAGMDSILIPTKWSAKDAGKGATHIIKAVSDARSILCL